MDKGEKKAALLQPHYQRSSLIASSRRTENEQKKRQSSLDLREDLEKVLRKETCLAGKFFGGSFERPKQGESGTFKRWHRISRSSRSDSTWWPNLVNATLGRVFKGRRKHQLICITGGVCLWMWASCLQKIGDQKHNLQTTPNYFPPCLESLVQELTVRARTTPTRLAERVLF